MKDIICPYLGQRFDPGTAFSYPSEVNCCYHAKPAAEIDTGHQELFCLTSLHSNCKEYVTDPGAALPGATNGNSPSRSLKKNLNRNWVFAIIFLSLGMIAGWQLITRWDSINSYFSKPTVISRSIETNAGSTSTFISTNTVTPPTPTAVDTATTRPSMGLEIPLGIDHKYLIHQILEGESLEKIAGKYGTTKEALLASNYRLPSPLLPLPGWVIVVPLNIVDTQDLPAFEVYSVKEEISLEDLANRLSVELNEFKYYNALGDDFIPRPGDWFLVPRIGTPTPTP